MPNRPNRRRELLCLGYFLVATIAIRLWILVIDTYNVYLEIFSSILTFFILVGIYLRIRRRQNNDDPEDNEREDGDLPRDQREVIIAQLLLISFEQRNTATGALPQEMIAALPRKTFTLMNQDESEEGGGPGKVPCCSICLENYAEADTLLTLPCHHDYHENCIRQWLQNHQTCPLCTRPVVVAQNNRSNSTTGGNNSPQEEENRLIRPPEIV